MSISIILTGHLRCDGTSRLDRFKKIFTGCDLYICTYPKFRDIARQLTDNYILYDPGYTDPGHINQWAGLQKVLYVYRHQLSKYKIICKMRLDIDYINLDSVCEHFQSRPISPGVVYAHSDKTFYSDNPTFYTNFGDIFDNMYSYRHNGDLYYDINYDNMLNSDITYVHPTLPYQESMCVRSEWFVYPERVINTPAPCGSWHDVKPFPNTNQKKKIALAWKKQLLKNIKNNIQELNSKNFERVYINTGRPTKDTILSSEKYFGLNCINNGPVKASTIMGRLMRNRFKYN